MENGDVPLSIELGILIFMMVSSRNLPFPKTSFQVAMVISRE